MPSLPSSSLYGYLLRYSPPVTPVIQGRSSLEKQNDSRYRKSQLSEKKPQCAFINYFYYGEPKCVFGLSQGECLADKTAKAVRERKKNSRRQMTSENNELSYMIGSYLLFNALLFEIFSMFHNNPNCIRLGQPRRSVVKMITDPPYLIWLTEVTHAADSISCVFVVGSRFMEEISLFPPLLSLPCSSKFPCLFSGILATTHAILRIQRSFLCLFNILRRV